MGVLDSTALNVMDALPQLTDSRGSNCGKTERLFIEPPGHWCQISTAASTPRVNIEDALPDPADARGSGCSNTGRLSTEALQRWSQAPTAASTSDDSPNVAASHCGDRYVGCFELLATSCFPDGAAYAAQLLSCIGGIWPCLSFLSSGQERAEANQRCPRHRSGSQSAWRKGTGCFHQEAKIEPLGTLDLRCEEHLAHAINGEVFRAAWDGRGNVAVKRMPNWRIAFNRWRQTCESTLHFESWLEPSVEDALTEIGVLALIARQPHQSPHVVQMYGAFQDLTHTYLVTEFADGGDLFGLVAACATLLPEDRVRHYTQQVLRAAEYLHGLRVGHRDISLENVLVARGVAKLMDFGTACRTHAVGGQALRYFMALGKDAYRPPECCIPKERTAVITAPAGARPSAVVMASVSSYLCEVKLPREVVPRRPCQAVLWGYAAPPVDVFACGVCAYMLAWRHAPWGQTRITDEHFAQLVRGERGLRGLLELRRRSPLSPAAMKLMAQMLGLDPARRPSPQQCLTSAWFASQA